MDEASEPLVARALNGDATAIGRLVDRFTPVLQARIARLLLRSDAGRDRDIRQEVADHLQDVILHLFDDDGQALREWQPGRGLSLDDYVCLVAERRAIGTMRGRRRTPWRATGAPDDHPEFADAGATPEPLTVGQDFLDTLLDAMQADLSPLGWHLFELIYIDEREPREVAAITGLLPDAIHAWRSRLRKTARRLRETLRPERAQPDRR